MFIIFAPIYTRDFEAGEDLIIKNEEGSTHFYTRLLNSLCMTQWDRSIFPDFHFSLSPFHFICQACLSGKMSHSFSVGWYYFSHWCSSRTLSICDALQTILYSFLLFFKIFQSMSKEKEILAFSIVWFPLYFYLTMR